MIIDGYKLKNHEAETTEHSSSDDFDADQNAENLVKSFLWKMNKPLHQDENWPNFSLKQIRSFEKWILSKEIKSIDPHTITRLLIGDSNNGLLSLIWDSPTHIATQNLLGLLAKLLDYEKNIFAEAYN